jgi:hypothetical protein
MSNLLAHIHRSLKKSEQQIPRGLKPARDDNNKGLERGAEAPHYPGKAPAQSFSAACEVVLCYKAPKGGFAAACSKRDARMSTEPCSLCLFGDGGGKLFIPKA